jgi:hypothetical protein
MNYLKMTIWVAGIERVILGNRYSSAQTQSDHMFQCKKVSKTMASNRDEDYSLEPPNMVSRDVEGQKKK